MEGMKNVSDLLNQGNYMVKIDLKDAYWHIPIHQDSRKLLRFRWDKKLYEMGVLAFGVGPGPRIFTKLLKVPLTILRRLMIKLVAYLDDLLIMGKSIEETLQARDSVLYLFQQLGFTINWEKSVLQPTQEIEFLGMNLNSATMTVWLPQEKAQNLLNLCLETLRLKRISLRGLASLIGKLQATLPAISMAPMQVRALQQDLISAQKKNMSYEQDILLSQESQSNLQWWINNITLSQGAPLKLGNPDMVMHTDASSSEGWGASRVGGRSTGGVWTKEEKEKYHINELELLAAEIALKTFLKDQKPKLVHLVMDNMTALHYLIRKGGTKSMVLTEISKRIWEFLYQQGTMITASWIPSKENTIADWRSRQEANSSEWELSNKAFQKIVNLWGIPEIDCFASRIMHKVPLYMSLNPDPDCVATNALYQDWGSFPYLFPPFCLIGRILKILKERQTPKAIVIAPLWPGQPWFSVLLTMIISEPICLSRQKGLLRNHPLIKNNSLHLAAFLVSGNNFKSRAFLSQLPKLCSKLGDQALHVLTKPLGKNGFCGVMSDRLIPLRHLWN